MSMAKIAYKYLKRYQSLSMTVFIAIIISSVFEGASFGMLIPLIQGMTNSADNMLGKIPLLKHLNLSMAGTDQTRLLSWILGIMFMILLVKNVFAYMSNLLIAKLRLGTSRDLAVSLMNNIIGYDLKFFDTAKSGHLMTSINVETVRMGDFIMAALNLATVSVRVGTYIILLFLISWKASIVVFVLIACVMVPLEYLMKKLKHLGGMLSKAWSDYNFKLLEILNGIRVVKGSGAEERERGSFKNAADSIYDIQYNTNKYIYLRIPMSEIFIFGMTVLSLLVIINVTKVNIPAVFPYAAVFLVILTKALTQLNLLNSYRSNAMSNMASFSSYEELMDGKSKRTIEDGTKTIIKFSDSIRFDRVVFSYNGSSHVLNGVSLTIEKGKITAIVGTSGVGKSTLVNLIMRFYDVESGGILVDGTDIRELTLKGWRSKIGLVSQDIFIFNDSVRRNISYGLEDLNDEKVREAAAAAGIDDFIMSLTDGYDTVVGERGVQLSGGQKQRLSIARAIVRDPEILILDEATSSLDSETEKLINVAIDRISRDRTVIAIAHRLSTVVRADNIVVLDGGAIAENGSHPELLRKNGVYKRLYDVQFGGEAVKSNHGGIG